MFQYYDVYHTCDSYLLCKLFRHFHWTEWACSNDYIRIMISYSMYNYVKNSDNAFK